VEGTKATYRTIAGTGTHELVIKKSRFIGAIARATTEQEARDFIERIRHEHWSANHNCSAYCIGIGQRVQRSNDDGEPAGTAGLPMLEVLRRRDLTDVVAVVTRYFGGILLGASGLIRAYSQTISETIDVVGIVERKPLTVVHVTADYQDAGALENALRATEFQLGPVCYEARVTFELYLDSAELPAFTTWLAQATNGRAHPRTVGQRYAEIPARAGKE
jgi:uncharacterized YigZ family protein